MTKPLSSLEEEFTNSVVLKVLINDMIIGLVRARQIGDTCEIRRLIVHTKYQKQGIDTQLLGAIEKEFGFIKRYELFTGSISIANIRLYERNGYSVTDTKSLSEKVSITYMEKHVT